MEPQSKEFYENDPIFQRLQYEIRQAYNEAWVECCRHHGLPVIQSPHNQPPVGWRESWLRSRARQFLIANGIMTGAVTWK